MANFFEALDERLLLRQLIQQFAGTTCAQYDQWYWKKYIFRVKDQLFNLMVFQDLLVEKIIENWSEYAEQ